LQRSLQLDPPASSSADLTSATSPKRPPKSSRPSTISLDYSRRHAPNANANLDPLDREAEVRLFGFRRIGTVFPSGLTKSSGHYANHFPDQKFMTLPHKKQVKTRACDASSSSLLLMSNEALCKRVIHSAHCEHAFMGVPLCSVRCLRRALFSEDCFM
jgi:hypothetical protein